MVLVLFDIDGTLLTAAGAGRRAIHRALIDVFGGVGPADYWFDGKTDPQIVRDLMRHEGHSDAVIDDRLGDVLTRYADRLGVELRDPSHVPIVHPGVPDLLDALESHPDVTLGLLTGNIEAGAAQKLRAVGLDPARFVIGAFGSDHEIRLELPSIAATRARNHLGYDVDLVVIGDTPADVACGAGANRRAIAVATGRYTLAELTACNPAAAFQDLSNTAAVMTAILGA
ncbi:MAG TPA: haloacid dehalogenase-like hydrolase [Gemmatimonadaceae bacterium]|nr:haloacid dehalogenase-like hydrolase [Gemmatimonadaceae bacterium]